MTWTGNRQPIGGAGWADLGPARRRSPHDQHFPKRQSPRPPILELCAAAPLPQRLHWLLQEPHPEPVHFKGANMRTDRMAPLFSATPYLKAVTTLSPPLLPLLPAALLLVAADCQFQEPRPKPDQFHGANLRTGRAASLFSQVGIDPVVSERSKAKASRLEGFGSYRSKGQIFSNKVMEERIKVHSALTHIS